MPFFGLGVIFDFWILLIYFRPWKRCHKDVKKDCTSIRRFVYCNRVLLRNHPFFWQAKSNHHPQPFLRMKNGFANIGLEISLVSHDVSRHWSKTTCCFPLTPQKGAQPFLQRNMPRCQVTTGTCLQRLTSDDCIITPQQKISQVMVDLNGQSKTTLKTRPNNPKYFRSRWYFAKYPLIQWRASPKLALLPEVVLTKGIYNWKPYVIAHFVQVPLPSLPNYKINIYSK